MVDTSFSKFSLHRDQSNSPVDSGSPLAATDSKIAAPHVRATQELGTACLRAGIVPEFEWLGATLRLHLSSQASIPESFTAELRGIERQYNLTVELVQHHQIAIRDYFSDSSRAGLSNSSQVIRALRSRLHARYGEQRRWRVSEDFQSKNIVLFYSGSELKPQEEDAVRTIVRQTTSLPVRIERRLNQTLLAEKILKSKPEIISASSPAFFDERFAVVRVPHYEPDSPGARAVRSWQTLLHQIGRTHGVGIVLRSSAVSNSFFRVLEQRATEGDGIRVTSAEAVASVRKFLFPEPPRAIEPVVSTRPLLDLPFLSIDPLGRDNMRAPDDTLLSEADPEDIVWAARRADGGFRVVVGIYDITGFIDSSPGMLQHVLKFGQSHYSPFQSYPLLGPEIAFSKGCFSEGRVGAAFAIDLEVSWDGKIETSSIYEANMRNHAHLSFGRADAIYNGQFKHELAPVMDVLKDFAMARRTIRRAQWDVQLESHSRGTSSGFASLSGIVIEEAMIAAKYAVGRFLTERGYTAIHRVYGQPSQSQQKGLLRKLRGLGVTAENADLIEPRRVVALITGLREFERTGNIQQKHESRGILNDIFSWLQFGASYSVDPKGHSGLSLRYFSPIKGREGAGVVNQLLLRSALREEGAPPFEPGKLHTFARLLSRQDDLYGGRLYGLVYLQAIEHGIELAAGRSFSVRRDAADGTLRVPEFDRKIGERLSDFPGLADELRAVVVDPAASGKTGSVVFDRYDLKARSFVFRPGIPAGPLLTKVEPAR